MSRVGSDHAAMNTGSEMSGHVAPRSGFTLIELLVVVTVIAMLVGLIMTAVGGIRAKALDRQVESEVRSLAMAVRAYRSEIGDWPVPSAQADTGGVWSNNNYLIFNMLVKANNSRRNYLELTNISAGASATLKDSYKAHVSYVVDISVTNNTVTVKSAGRDGVLGNGDDVSITY